MSIFSFPFLPTNYVNADTDSNSNDDGDDDGSKDGDDDGDDVFQGWR